MSTIVKTAKGKTLDMSKLAMNNAKTIPVGNMPNDKNPVKLSNDTVASGTRRSKNGGRRQISKQVFDTPVYDSTEMAQTIAEQYVENTNDDVLVEPVTMVEVKEPEEPKPKVHKPRRTKSVNENNASDADYNKVVEATKTKSVGLAGAIAKAKEVKQEPMKTPREEQRGVEGVKRI